MSQEQYALLIFRLIFTVVIGLGAVLGSLIGVMKSAQYLWDLLMNHIRLSIKGSYCTPSELSDAVADIKAALTAGFASGEKRFAAGDDRIAKLEKRVSAIPVCRFLKTDDCPSSVSDSSGSAS